MCFAHLHILFGEISFPVFCPFSDWIVWVFLLVHFVICLPAGIIVLCQITITNIFHSSGFAHLFCYLKHEQRFLFGKSLIYQLFFIIIV